MEKRKKRRPLFDGTAWLLILWALAFGVGIFAGTITAGDASGAETAAETAQLARDFMAGATPFWIVSGIALIGGIALDDLTGQFGNRDD